MESRTDLYSLPHKSLRHALHEGGAALGAGDTGPAAGALELLASHGQHEDEFIGPVLTRYLPDLAATVTAQHEVLEGMLASVRSLLGGDLVEAYRSYHRLVAWNLAHLDEEETVVLPALWSAAPERALAEVFASFRVAHPDAGDIYVRWPQPLTATERRLVGVG